MQSALQVRINNVVKERTMPAAIGFSTIDPLKILQLGIIGLGFLLAVLAFLLLWKVAKRDNPAPQLLKAIYVLEGFSIALVILGRVAQLLQVLRPRPDCTPFASQLKAIQTDINSMASTEQDTLTDMNARRDKYRKTEEDNRSVQQGLSDRAKAQADALDDEIAKSASGFNSRLVTAQKTINDAVEVCAK
jgi:hypothetical protein